MYENKLRIEKEKRNEGKGTEEEKNLKIILSKVGINLRHIETIITLIKETLINQLMWKKTE